MYKKCDIATFMTKYKNKKELERSKKNGWKFYRYHPTR